MATIAITGGPMRITNRISARVRAEHFHRSRFDARAMPEATSVAVAFKVNSSARTSVMPSSSYMKLIERAQLALLFLDQSVELVKQFAIALTDRIDNASEDRLDSICALT